MTATSVHLGRAWPSGLRVPFAGSRRTARAAFVGLLAMVDTGLGLDWELLRRG